MQAPFDTNGYLYPYQLIKMELDDLQNIFVFTAERKLLYDELLGFISTLILDFGIPMELWVNGSFVSLKSRPKDIDIVIFIDDKMLQLHENKLIETRIQTNNLDIYFVRLYPEFHDKAFISAFDKTEWLHLFSKDKGADLKDLLKLQLMEIDNEKHIIIITTIETIERLSKAISFHETQAEPDLLTIGEYKRLRNNLKRQLKDMLSDVQAYPFEMAG